MKEDHIFLVEWSCAYKRNKSVKTLNFGRIVVHIDSAKMPEHEGSISPSSFYEQLPDYQSHIFSPMYPVDEFSIRKNEHVGSVQNSILLFLIWCELRELGGRGSSGFPCVKPVVESSSDRVIFRILSTTELLCENRQRT